MVLKTTKILRLKKSPKWKIHGKTAKWKEVMLHEKLHIIKMHWVFIYFSWWIPFTFHFHQPPRHCWEDNLPNSKLIYFCEKLQINSSKIYGLFSSAQNFSKVHKFYGAYRFLHDMCVFVHIWNCKGSSEVDCIKNVEYVCKHFI